MSNTARLNMPNLVSGQAQKEITHNMALQRLDAFVQTAVESMTLVRPPAGVEGNLYVVGTPATGAWAGKDGQLAYYVGGTWAFYVPFDGMRIWNKATAEAMVYKAANWVNEIAAAEKISFFGAAPINKISVSLTNEDGAFTSLTFSATPTQAECQAFRDKCEVLADDLRLLKAALSGYGLL